MLQEKYWAIKQTSTNVPGTNSVIITTTLHCGLPRTHKWKINASRKWLIMLYKQPQVPLEVPWTLKNIMESGRQGQKWDVTAVKPLKWWVFIKTRSLGKDSYFSWSPDLCSARPLTVNKIIIVVTGLCILVCQWGYHQENTTYNSVQNSNCDKCGCSIGVLLGLKVLLLLVFHLNLQKWSIQSMYKQC